MVWVPHRGLKESLIKGIGSPLGKSWWRALSDGLLSMHWDARPLIFTLDEIICGLHLVLKQMHPYPMNNWHKKICAKKLCINDNANNFSKSEEWENGRVTICLGFYTISLPTTSPVKAVSIQSNKKEAPKSALIRSYLKYEVLLLSLLFHPKYVLCLDILKDVAGSV